MSKKRKNKRKRGGNKNYQGKVIGVSSMVSCSCPKQTSQITKVNIRSEHLFEVRHFVSFSSSYLRFNTIKI